MYMQQSIIAALICLPPLFSSCISYALFVEIPRYLEIPPIDFCETLYDRTHAPKYG